MQLSKLSVKKANINDQ